MTTSVFPKIIQGGMGVNISDWRLARAVSALKQQGTVSGVAPERVLGDILQHGDPGEIIRQALAKFPFQKVVQLIMKEYFVAGGIGARPRKNVPVFTINPSALLISLVICANYAFVRLAKEGHVNPVSINYLEKIAPPHIYAITGAMLADVDFITMGAGIALQIPEVITCIATGKEAHYDVPVSGTNIKSHTMRFDPTVFFGEKLPEMRKPGFIPIIGSDLLASIFVKKLPNGAIHGFAVEGKSAGGHTGRPRKPIFDSDGRMLPIYGPKDNPDYAKIANLGLPFWIGGDRASPEKLADALSKGAKGIQVGSIFALCEESGMNPLLRKQARKLGFNGQLQVVTDMRFSPTGFPFKVACLDGTLSDKKIFVERPLVCNQGVLVSLYEKPDGSIGYRCPSEPLGFYRAKGGDLADAVGRGCLCNALLSTAMVNNPAEPPIVTLGDETGFLKKLMLHEDDFYTAKDAIWYLLGEK